MKGRRILAWLHSCNLKVCVCVCFLLNHVLIKMSLFIRGFQLCLIEPFHVNKLVHPTSSLMNIKGGCCPRKEMVYALLPNKLKTMRVIKISTFTLNYYFFVCVSNRGRDEKKIRDILILEKNKYGKMEIRWSKANNNNDNTSYLSYGLKICFTCII